MFLVRLLSAELYTHLRKDEDYVIFTGTVYEPIYEACGKNVSQSGLFFGLIVFYILMNREDKVWGFGRFEKDGKQIASMTYFVLDNPPER